MKKGFKFTAPRSKEHREAIGRGQKRYWDDVGRSKDRRKKERPPVVRKLRRWHLPPRLWQQGITPEIYKEKIAAGFKWCSFHKDFESIEKFGNVKKDGDCSEGRKLRQQTMRAKWTPRYRREIVLRTHGATVEWYDARIQEQSGRCAICCAPEHQKRHFHVDHDRAHCSGSKSCGQCNRGLLCDICNRRLGYLEKVLAMTQSIEAIPDSWLAKALAYLAQYAHD